MFLCAPQNQLEKLYLKEAYTDPQPEHVILKYSEEDLLLAWREFCAKVQTPQTLRVLSPPFFSVSSNTHLKSLRYNSVAGKWQLVYIEVLCTAATQVQRWLSTTLQPSPQVPPVKPSATALSFSLVYSFRGFGLLEGIGVVCGAPF